MTPRIVVTSGDPATGVITIEQAPTTACPNRCRGLSTTSKRYRTGPGGKGSRVCDCVGGRVPVSLPATVEVAERCSNGFGDYYDSHSYRCCDGSGFVVLGTATLDAWIDEGDDLVAYLTDWNPT